MSYNLECDMQPNSSYACPLPQTSLFFLAQLQDAGFMPAKIPRTNIGLVQNDLYNARSIIWPEPVSASLFLFLKAS